MQKDKSLTLEHLDRLYLDRFMEVQDIFDWSDAIEESWPSVRAVLRNVQELIAYQHDEGVKAAKFVELKKSFEILKNGKI